MVFEDLELDLDPYDDPEGEIRASIASVNNAIDKIQKEGTEGEEIVLNKNNLKLKE